MQPDVEFSGTISDLLVRWITGDSISSLRGNFAPNSSPEELPRFVEDFFGYRLPWGISGANRIATGVLGLDPNAISEYVRYFPSIVKLGVPSVQAAWAASIGVPSRHTAMRVAEVFLKESEVANHSSFLRWIESVDRLRWAEEFNLSGTALDDVTRAIALISKNPLLRTGFQPLPTTVMLHITERSQTQEAAKIKSESEVFLRRDYNNTADRNAVEVLFQGNSIGFLPRYLGQTIAPEIDAGTRFNAVATGVIVPSQKAPLVTVSR
jgi:hypothetical protein